MQNYPKFPPFFSFKKLNYQSPITPVDYPAFNMYGWGIPCRSVLIPRNFSDEFADHLKRPSEVEIGHCEHPCPTAPPMVSASPSIIDRQMALK
jgi:hypothetical protein